MKKRTHAQQVELGNYSAQALWACVRLAHDDNGKAIPGVLSGLDPGAFALFAIGVIDGLVDIIAETTGLPYDEMLQRYALSSANLLAEG